MSKSSILSKKIKQYILDNVDGSGYDANPTTDAEKVAFIHDTFLSEKGWYIDRVGMLTALIDWYQGLPSSVNTVHMNSDILELAEQWGYIDESSTEAQQTKVIDNWWNLLANKTMQLFREYL